jgi:hypothetical protein
MKNKFPLLFIIALVVAGALANSCKKDKNSNIPALLASGVWQLASIQVYHYTGNTQVGNPDTLNTDCDKNQYFTFKSDNTCSYTNFDCIEQTSTGTWTLTENRLYFSSDMVAKDTVAGGTMSTEKPFDYTQIETLGNYSLVLQTGDVEPNYSATKARTVVRYGFIRQKAITSSN